ncbi:unnamed protein product [Brassica rapa]|uniref:Uncharacterized protein n=1 Tax=Brassica campestris TaxID=3711 RepID=A0A8D9GTT7_BRACM|nr:unnamed protein product [Brassica rapa]
MVFQVLINSFLNCHGCTTKDVLVTSTYVHINCGSKFAKNASYLSTMCPRILLSGPAENISKSTCEIYIGDKLIILDSLILLGGSTAKEANFTKGSSWRGRLHVHVKRAVHLDDITGGSRLTSQTVKKYQLQPLKVTPLKQVWSFSFHFFVAFYFTL